MGLAKIASKHSREHDNYIQNFNQFDNQFLSLYNHYVNLSTMYPGVFLPQSYPTKPINSYTKFTFRDWLIDIAASNNTHSILSLTDFDDAGLLAEKVFIRGRHAACGHYNNEYNGPWNWCCGGHYTRSIKIEMFNLALNLVKNQTYHDNYVRDAKQFENSAKSIISNYWAGLRTWNGIPVLVSGTTTVVQSQPTTLHTSNYQNLKSNRDQLRGHLTKAIKVVGSASQCTTIANDISSTGERLCSEVDTYNSSRSHHEIKSGVIEGFTHLATSDLQNKIEDLSMQNKQFVSQILELESKNRELNKKVQDNDWEARERAIEAKYSKMLEERIEKEKERDKREVSSFLGRMLYELNSGRDDKDLDKFRDFSSFQYMIERAHILVLRPVEKLIANK
eukprot:TRINITY_DN1638_c0_g4_i1.p1 TRINITY_DN1638_c0_g4~~TRINITY_DN1638_c0_g4_i1.p1  ORF type:complete len:392 (-),score=7.81 TRINITY_DN1638_c0_g4_i1:494-1669(-)